MELSTQGIGWDYAKIRAKNDWLITKFVNDIIALAWDLSLILQNISAPYRCECFVFIIIFQGNRIKIDLQKKANFVEWKN